MGQITNLLADSTKSLGYFKIVKEEKAFYRKITGGSVKLPAFFKKTDSPKKRQYFFSLLLSQTYVSSSIWFLKDTTVEVVARSRVPYKADPSSKVSWERRIDAVDRAVTAVEEEVKEEIENVIFGLLPQYIKEEKIIADYLDGLKKLCSRLSLTPTGFVVIPEAIAYFLAKKEGAPLSAILVGVEKDILTVSLFKVGKALEISTLPRSEEITKDIEQAITGFVNIEVLPAKILLYNGEKELDKLTAELLNYSWQKHDSFLHFPKIESLPPDLAIEAVSLSGASELLDQELVSPVLDRAEKEKIVDASSLGFVKDEDVASPQPRMEVVIEKEEKKPSFVERIGKILPPFSLPALPRLPNIRLNIRLLIIFFIVGVFLGGAVAVSSYWTYPQAKLIILVDPRLLNEQVELIIDPSLTTADIDEAIIPGKLLEVKVAAEKSVAVTGTRTVGERARGGVTIYNKTTDEKTFAKGTALLGPRGLRFTLDEAVSVASISDVIVGTPGKQTAKVTAVAIGSDSNVPAGSDFSFADFPVTTYAARNENAFSGGSSRQVQAVSKDDRDNLSASLRQELSEKAKTQLTAGIESGEMLIEESLKSALSGQNFSHQEGEETNDLMLSAELSLTGIKIRKDDIFYLANKTFSAKIAENYSLRQDDVDLKIEKAAVNRQGLVEVRTRIYARLFPDIDTDNIRRNLAGQKISAIEPSLRNTLGIVGFELLHVKKLPFFEVLPPLSENLIVEVKPR